MIQIDRITPDFITTLKENECFVFGSNESGRHGRGSAKYALNFGARYGIGHGFSGQTYAIPTKDFKVKTLPIQRIEEYVQIFFDIILQYTNVNFLVTPIGCGLAGYSPKEISPLFYNFRKYENVYLPQSFWDNY